MTIDEAIKILRDTPIDIRSTREDDIHTLYATAQGMAIEALQRGLENVNADSCSEKPNESDVIKRQDAIDALSIYGDKLTLDNVAERIYGLPSAQPERKKGEWKRNITTERNAQLIFTKVYNCSECGYESVGNNLKNYCPNCGARMRGDTE